LAPTLVPMLTILTKAWRIRISLLLVVLPIVAPLAQARASSEARC